MQEEPDGGVRTLAQAGLPTGAGRVRNFVVFLLGASRYAIPCERVVEIMAAVSIQRLPKAPPVVEGAINVRGTIVPVLDVGGRFGAPRASLHPDQHFILALSRGRTVALHVDRAEEVVGVTDDEIRPATEVPGMGYVAGIAPIDRGLLVIHDLDAFLAADEAVALDAALADAAV
jgi:purine-binding chemotaxis protein CheW